MILLLIKCVKNMLNVLLIMGPQKNASALFWVLSEQPKQKIGTTYFLIENCNISTLGIEREMIIIFATFHNVQMAR